MAEDKDKKALAVFKEMYRGKTEQWKGERAKVAGREVAGNIAAPVAVTILASVAGQADGRYSAGQKDGKPHHPALYTLGLVGLVTLGFGAVTGRPTVARIGSETLSTVGASAAYVYNFQMGLESTLKAVAEAAAKKAALAAAPAVPAAGAPAANPPA
jgi:hypothetical protein